MIIQSIRPSYLFSRSMAGTSMANFSKLSARRDGENSFSEVKRPFWLHSARLLAHLDVDSTEQ